MTLIGKYRILSNAQLVVGYANGDDACLEMLMKRHRDFLYSYIVEVCGTMLAEDALQETWIDLAANFKAGKYREEIDEEGKDKFLTYIKIVARFKAIEAWKRNHNIPPGKVNKLPMIIETETLPDQEDDTLNEQELLEKAETNTALLNGLRHLSLVEKRIVVFRLHKKGFALIANILALKDAGLVRVIYFRALKKIRRYLGHTLAH